jgi:hypothetical protein
MPPDAGHRLREREGGKGERERERRERDRKREREVTEGDRESRKTKKKEKTKNGMNEKETRRKHAGRHTDSILIHKKNCTSQTPDHPPLAAILVIIIIKVACMPWLLHKL